MPVSAKLPLRLEDRWQGKQELPEPVHSQVGAWIRGSTSRDHPRPKRSFQLANPARIASAFMRGLNSHTNRQFSRQQRDQPVVVDAAHARHAMVGRRPLGVMEMAPEQPVPDGFEPFVMVQKPEVVLDLDVPEIVPVTDVRRVDLVEQRRVFPLGGKFLVGKPALAAEIDVFPAGVLDDGLQAVQHALPVHRGLGLALLHGSKLELDPFAGVLFALPRQQPEPPGSRTHRNAPQVQHDQTRAQPCREINRLDGQLHRPPLVERPVAGELVAIRRRSLHFEWQRAEIVQAGDAHLARIDDLLNPAHQRYPHAVGKLDVIKPEIADFAQHARAFLVAGRIPAAGKGKHREAERMKDEG